ncbi:DUF190 domain-containing protein [Desulfocurvus sp. DL9XJH121]
MSIADSCQIKNPQEAERLTIYSGEQDLFEGRPVHEVIVEDARKNGLAGATVLRGISGFGANSLVHTTKILRLSEDLPIMTQIVDSPAKIDAFLPRINAIIKEGLVVRETVQVLVYRHCNGTKD